MLKIGAILWKTKARKAGWPGPSFSVMITLEGAPTLALLGRGFFSTGSLGANPIRSRRRAVHSDSTSTIPSVPVTQAGCRVAHPFAFFAKRGEVSSAANQKKLQALRERPHRTEKQRNKVISNG